jgi:hypothetical protein
MNERKLSSDQYVAFSHRCWIHRREWNSEQQIGGYLRSGWGKRTSGCIHLRRTTKETTRGQTNWMKKIFFNLEFLSCRFRLLSNLEFLKMLEFGAGQAADWFRSRERGKNSILRSCNWDTADWQAHVYQEGNHRLRFSKHGGGGGLPTDPLNSGLRVFFFTGNLLNM